MILDFVENKETSEFFPTPAELVQRMINKVDWNMIQTILEPSAGKGNILKEIARITKERNNKIDVDCIELDRNLRQILKYNFSKEYKDEIFSRRKEILSKYKYSEHRYGIGWAYYNDEKGKYVPIPEKDVRKIDAFQYDINGFFSNDIHIVHDNFMTFQSFKQYDLIIMNPPFSNGDRHLLKALEIQKNGGSIICLLNAETLRNPYTATRQELVSKLEKYDADIEYISNAFLYSERRTDVEVALIKVSIPKAEPNNSIFERMAKVEHYEEPDAETITDIEVTDYIKAIVNRYKVEVKSGIELINLYNGMLPYLARSFNTKEYDCNAPILVLKKENGSDKVTVNEYLKAVRMKYWKALLNNEKFIGKLTSKLQNEYRERVYSFANYDFSEFNIYNLSVEINSQIKSGIENEIAAMYDRLTIEHTYNPEFSKNLHYYDGWKTNKAYKIDKKVILPCYGIFDVWNGKPRTYAAYEVLADIERILNFFNGNITADVDLLKQINLSFNRGISKNIETKYFKVTFYKKGTAHITFTCSELIDRFNIYIAKEKRWLPPSYGKKAYEDMTVEEQTVIDNFQGKAAYEKVMEKPDYYLASPVSDVKNNLIEMAG